MIKVEEKYYEMQYQKQVREEQKAAQLAQEAKQRELDENIAKLSTAQFSLTAATTAYNLAVTAVAENEDPDQDEALEAARDTAAGEVSLYEAQVDGLNELFAEIEADLAAEAEQARQKRIEEQKNTAYWDAYAAKWLYEGYVNDLNARLQEYRTMRPTTRFTKADITDAIARNQAALQEAEKLYNSADDKLYEIQALQLADEEAFEEGQGGRELADAELRLQNYEESITELAATIESFEGKRDATASERMKQYYDY